MANGLSAADIRSLSVKCIRLAENIKDERISAALKEMAAELGTMADRAVPTNAPEVT